MRLPRNGAGTFGSDSEIGISEEVLRFSSVVTTDDDVGDFEYRVTYVSISWLGSEGIWLTTMLSAASLNSVL